MNESRATRYQRLRRRAAFASVASAGLMLAATALTPLSRWLSELSRGLAGGLPPAPASAVSLALFVVLVLALWELASLPAAIYLARHVDAAYGQSPSSVEAVMGEQLHATAVALPAALVGAAAVMVSVGWAGVWWWAAAGALLTCFLAVVMNVVPLVFALLGRMRPIDRPDLVARLQALAARARTPLAGIDEWVVDESARTTAVVAGVGRTRRILLASDLVRRWSDDEITVVVAHELAHHVYRDLWRTLALHACVLWGSLFAADVLVRLWSGPLRLAGPGDLAALPLIALVTSAGWILATPVRHAQSRRHERRADTFALAMTDRVDAFGAAVARLGARHLAEERPSMLTRWLYNSHPTVAERLAMADAFRRVRPR
jgi:STE24 endopeptidase